MHALFGVVSRVASAQRAVFCTQFLPLIAFCQPLPHIVGALTLSVSVVDNPSSSRLREREKCNLTKINNYRHFKPDQFVAEGPPFGSPM